MLALKLILMVAGALMLLVAAAIPLVGVWRRVQLARNKAAAEGTVEKMETEDTESEAIPWRRPVALAVVGCFRCWWRPALWWCPAAWAVFASARCAAHCPARFTLECTS